MIMAVLITFRKRKTKTNINTHSRNMLR
jgi:hypothetical protein